MKKICLFTAFAAVLVLVSCNKDPKITPANDVVSITVGYEEPIVEPSTKMSISETGDTFTLLFDGESNSMRMGNTSNTTLSDFSTTSSGATATYTGTLPKITESATTNYVGIVSTFGSVTGTNIRGAVAAGQLYNGAAIGKSCFLAGRTDGCTVGTLTSMSLKTINAFLKLSLIKGTPVDGATHTYTNMYVKNIVIESVNGEQIAGKYAVSKSGDEWFASYVSDVGIDAADKNNKITLDCTNGGETAGVLLSASAEDFYIALGFGTYAQGLKVTINVQNAKDGDAGKMEGYIQKSDVDKSYTFYRNKLVEMPTLTVRPVDAVTDIICWSENWTGAHTAAAASDSAKPSACSSSGTVVYGGGSVTYSEASNKTYVRNDSTGGGTAPELLLNPDGAWTISDIPTADAAKLSLTYKSNNSKSSVAISGGTATIEGSSKNYTITTNGESTITLVFSTTGNSRIDDIVLKVKND